MHLIVEQLALFLRAWNVRELAAADGVARRHEARAEQVEPTALNNRQTRQAHNRVEQSRVGSQLKLTLFGDLGEACEECATRDLHLIEQ